MSAKVHKAPGVPAHAPDWQETDDRTRTCRHPDCDASEYLFKPAMGGRERWVPVWGSHVAPVDVLPLPRKR